MRYRSLGTSGLVVSVAGLGGNNFGPHARPGHPDRRDPRDELADLDRLVPSASG